MTSPVIDVLDDDRAFRDSLAFLLSARGFSVRTHEDPAAFLRGVASQTPDCLVCDIRMPGMSGLDVIRALHERDLRTRVILVTGHADPSLLDRALEAGASRVLEKPFVPQQLITAIEEVLGLD